MTSKLKKVFFFFISYFVCGQLPLHIKIIH